MKCGRTATFTIRAGIKELPIKEHHYTVGPEMPAIQCLIDGCEHRTPDVEPVMTKDDVLTAMRRFAVREDNTMVARATLHNLQDRDEPIRAFGARLKGL